MSNLRRICLLCFACLLLLTGCGADGSENSILDQMASADTTESAAASAADTSQQTEYSDTTAADTDTDTYAEEASNSFAETSETEAASTSVSTMTLGWTTSTYRSSAAAASTAASEKTTRQTSSASYPISEEYHQFLSKCVFVGDSICSGLKAYKILPDDQVVAKGSVGVRSIFDNKFSVGGSDLDIITALTKLQPEYIIFSMGMNDINMTTAEKYCENYHNLLTKVQQALPNAKLYVASITPISNDSTFSTNAKIDTYNQTIRQYLTACPDWGYVDVTPALKNEWNGLKYDYSSGDGIHLSPAAYTAMLYQVCEQLAGSPAQTSAATATTTAAASETTGADTTE